jgi:CheY-like chemotaxis protein
MSNDPRFGKILIVDDSEEIRSNLSQMLRRFECTIVEASDGKQALEIILSEKNGHWLAIITDHQMPKLDGARLIRSLAQTTTFFGGVILLTAHPDTDEELERLKHEVSGRFPVQILRKPVSIQEIRKLISQAALRLIHYLLERDGTFGIV